MSKDFIPKVLVLGPGGIKGLLQVGAISYFEKTGLLDNVKEFVGCSIGSVICLLKICGYVAKDMIIEGSNVSIFENAEIDLTKATKDAGIVSMSIMANTIGSLVKMKMGKIPTLNELFMATGKILYCSTYNITEKKKAYISMHTHPDLSCVKACMMSCAVPILFGKMEYKKSIYIDGAIGDPYPISIFDDGKTDILGIYIYTDIRPQSQIVSTLVDLGSAILGIDEKIQASISKSSNRCRHLRLECGIVDMTGVSVSIREKAKLVIDGWNFAKSQFPSKITIDGLELEPIKHISDSSTEASMEDGKIVIKITKSTKLAIERMGIDINT